MAYFAVAHSASLQFLSQQSGSQHLGDLLQAPEPLIPTEKCLFLKVWVSALQGMLLHASKFQWSKHRFLCPLGPWVVTASCFDCTCSFQSSTTCLTSPSITFSVKITWRFLFPFLDREKHNTPKRRFPFLCLVMFFY